MSEEYDDEEEIENESNEENDDDFSDELAEEHAHIDFQSDAVRHSALHGMYRTWFLDYASYVNLDRAVPYIEDGLKPVQRRVLHTMYKMEDGRFNKVANIVGATMSLHPHGDASINDALVTLGQKALLVDTQGNWGNILNGEGAAAGRYIEARLTKFALDVVFNPKTTIWKESYDGRDKEPVTLPVKFPLLLAQGCKGIGVGLSSIILPHNFCELLDASIAYLRGQDFVLYPDFPTGGSIDVSKYNDGLRGGKLRIRAKIEKRDARTLVITEIPYTVTSKILADSIKKAIETGKIKAKDVKDNTTSEAAVVVSLPAGSSPDKTIDALYAFTKCEDSVSPNACVVIDRKPCFLTISEILRANTDRTVDLLRQELQIRLGELQQQWHILSLEKIFIELERIYKDKEYEQAKSQEEACLHIDKRLRKHIADNNMTLLRDISREDVLHLLDIKMGRIIQFNAEAADRRLAALQDEMQKVNYNIEHIIDFTIAHFERLKKQYGADHPRLTEIRSFDNIEAVKIIERNRKLYLSRADGFMGYGLRGAEYVCDCSDLDDIIIFYEDGTYVIKKVDEKVGIGMNVLHIDVFNKNDNRTVYNAVYTDGTTRITYAKRFNVSGITRDREYDLTQGTKGTRLRYFSANSNGEAEVVKVLLRPHAKMRNVVIDFDFATLAVKGRSSKGNIVTKNEIHKVVFKRRGESTLGGCPIWFESETLRLNPDGRGTLLGEFAADDKILLITNSGDATTIGTGFEQHFDDNIFKIEKFDSSKVWTAVYIDSETNQHYIKRFRIALSTKPINFIGENAKNTLVLLSDEDHPIFKVTFGGDDSWRPAETIDVFDFIAEKGIKAKGKRLASYPVSTVEELEPLIPTVRGQQADDDSTDEAEATNDDPSLL